MDCSLPGSSVHGIFQARILEWVVISCSRGSSWPWVGNCISCIAGKFFTDWTTRKALHIRIFPLVWTSFIHVFVHSLINKYPAPFMPLLWGAFQVPSLVWSSPCFGPQESASSAFFFFSLLSFFFFSFIFISWRLITLQYCSGVCHTLTWISHGFTCIPHPTFYIVDVYICWCSCPSLSLASSLRAYRDSYLFLDHAQIQQSLVLRRCLFTNNQQHRSTPGSEIHRALEPFILF